MSRESTESALIADDRSLRETADLLSGSRLIALDTEFVRESTYFPELCVLQVATDEIVAAVDCLAPIDLEPLFEALLAADATWVLHSARQDLEVLVNRAGRLPRALVDTQIAARRQIAHVQAEHDGQAARHELADQNQVAGEIRRVDGDDDRAQALEDPSIHPDSLRLEDRRRERGARVRSVKGGPSPSGA